MKFETKKLQTYNNNNNNNKKWCRLQTAQVTNSQDLEKMNKCENETTQQFIRNKNKNKI